MSEYFIFSDASFDPKSRRGMCATLILPEDKWDKTLTEPIFEIQVKRIDGENCARLEFIGAMLALSEWREKFHSERATPKITLVIDCKAIQTLLERRERLEKSQFLSHAKGQILANADLYKAFLTVYDELRPRIFWVKGHSAKGDRSELQEVFSLVDKLARRKLRDSFQGE